MIKGQTFANQKIRAEDQAIVNSFAIIQNDGVLKGIGTDVIITNNGGLFTLGAGKILCQGRIVDVEQNTQISIPVASGSSIVKGYLILKIDLSEEPPNIDADDYAGQTPQCVITYKDGVAGEDFPELIQNDLNDGGSIYELALMSYHKTNAGFSDVTRVVRYVNKNHHQNDCVEKATNAYHAPTQERADSSTKIATTAYVQNHEDYNWKEVQKSTLTSNTKDWRVEHDFDFTKYDYKIRTFLKCSGASASVAAHFFLLDSSAAKVSGSYGALRNTYYSSDYMANTAIGPGGELADIQTTTSDGIACIDLTLHFEPNTDTLMVITDAISCSTSNTNASGCNSMSKKILGGLSSKTPTKVQIYSYSPTWYANSTMIISRQRRL